MARCSTLGEAATGMTEVENIDEVVATAELQHAFGENAAASDGEKCPASSDIEDTLSEVGSDNENS
jgi:hypothetical protein